MRCVYVRPVGGCILRTVRKQRGEREETDGKGSQREHSMREETMKRKNERWTETRQAKRRTLKEEEKKSERGGRKPRQQESDRDQ